MLLTYNKLRFGYLVILTSMDSDNNITTIPLMFDRYDMAHEHITKLYNMIIKYPESNPLDYSLILKRCFDGEVQIIKQLSIVKGTPCEWI